MDLDVKTPETAMPENDNSKPAEAGVTINTTVDKKEDVISPVATTSEPKEAPIKNEEPAPNNPGAVVERHAAGESLHDERARGGDPHSPGTDDPDS